MRSAKWTPDQQRTTPQERRAAQHPGNASLVLALTNYKHTFGISRRDAPEALMNLRPTEGRGECRVPAAPAVSCALGSGRTHTSNNEYTGMARHSRTQWF
jgi:hypothetical protein